MVFLTDARTEEIPSLFVKASKAGTIVYAPGSGFGPRIQPDLQLVHVHTGAMLIEIDGSERQVPAGHVTLLCPGHQEIFHFAKDHETWHRWIAISIDDIPLPLLQDLLKLPPFIPISERMNRMVELMLLLQDSGLECSESENDLARAALMLYLSEARQYSLIEKRHPAVLTVKQHIHQNYEQDLNLALLAGVAGVTKEHLIRLFKRDEGLTPTSYLWRYRVSQGIELLRSTGLSIGEIAERVGCKTSYHFARILKQHTGKTASELRKESWSRK